MSTRRKRITPAVVARFQAEELLQGNGSAAIEIMQPDIINRGDKAHRIRKYAEKHDIADYVPQRVQQIAKAAIDRIEDMVNSTDERIATQNSHFIVELAIGKAVQRSETASVNLNIEAILR